MLISLSSPSGEATPLELRSYAEFDLRNKILAIPGVAQVVAIGGELPEYQVNVDQERLRIYNLTISDVVQFGNKVTSQSQVTLQIQLLPSTRVSLSQSGKLRMFD